MIWASFLTYLMVIFLLGVIAYRQTNSVEDYLLGGRRLGSLVAALSAGASDMSGWLMLGLPGLIYLQGLDGAWLSLGLLTGAYVSWRFIAAPLRSAAIARDNALTIPEFLSRAVNDDGFWLRGLSSLVILFFYTIYTAAGLVAAGKLFEQFLNIPYQWSVVIGAGIIFTYTSLGGFLAASWSDVLQGLLMMLALICIPLLAWIDLEQSVSPNLNFSIGKLPSLTIVSSLAWGLGYFGQPHILTRFMASRSTQTVHRARRIAMLWMLTSMMGAIATGLISQAIFIDPLLDEPETALIQLTQLLLTPALAGLVLAAIMAAVMSTVDSQLLVCSSAIVEDLYKYFRKEKAVDAQMIWLSRVALILVGLVALLLAFDPDSSVLMLVAYAWAGFGATFGPLILLSLYWPSLSVVGARSGLFAGLLGVILWENMAGGIFELYELLPAFVFAMAISIGFSLLFPGKGRKKPAYEP